MLNVQSEVDFYDDSVSGKTRFSQDIYLAMFSYGNQKRNFFHRCAIAWKYLISGNMHAAQLVLTQEEAKKLATFINENLIEGGED